MKKYIELKLNHLVMRGFEHSRSNGACLVMFHGFTGNKMETNRMFLNIDKMLDFTDISTLRFDWFGHGESDLDFSELDVELLLKQGQKIINYAKNIYRKVYVLGFSMGGAVAMNLLDLEPDKLILISPAINMYDITINNYRNNQMLNEGLVDLRGFCLSKNFVESFKKLHYKKPISCYKKPVLLIHGTKDQSVPIELSRSLSQGVNLIKFIEIDGADHGYGRYQYMETINQSIKQFLT
ncbi:MAG TPA: alpha/beta fold hydrolase [Candidatus Izemoplasmatales bacterium]|nr:alpha/beta fold hydrolase [Candidatus Izemoplasmatales bacterium]